MVLTLVLKPLFFSYQPLSPNFLKTWQVQCEQLTRWSPLGPCCSSGAGHIYAQLCHPQKLTYNAFESMQTVVQAPPLLFEQGIIHLSIWIWTFFIHGAPLSLDRSLIPLTRAAKTRDFGEQVHWAYCEENLSRSRQIQASVFVSIFAFKTVEGNLVTDQIMLQSHSWVEIRFVLVWFLPRKALKEALCHCDCWCYLTHLFFLIKKLKK